MRYTLAQLWYASGRRKLSDGMGSYRAARIGASITIVLFSFVLMVGGAVSPGPGVAVAVVLLVLVNVGLMAARPWFEARSRIRMPAPYEVFRRELLDRWPGIYGGLPSGAVDGTVARSFHGAPQFAVLCSDPGVIACLEANNSPVIWAMMATNRTGALPPDIPVFVLHDASLAGIAFAAKARSVLGKRAVTVGLLPRVVLANASILRLREPRPAAQELDFLRREALSQEEIDWLAAGWWSPIAAVPPAKLVAALNRALGRLPKADDPDQQAARQVGFLTWPTE
ncbi:hypothetical protein [Nocardia jejuensis]|uniref:hypothetical protein n=1 Tax=Nocardia jejuensis TaxID=328049 RepID=UPI0008372B5D|nr:hypothetical protein [Nocardia jejuensis]